MNRDMIGGLSRRRLLAMAAAGASVPLLSACAGRSGGDYRQPSGDTPAQFANRQRVVLWSAFTSTNAQVLQSIVDGFNASQSDIYCEIQLFPGYDAIDSKLAASLTARQVPDLVTLSDVNWNRYYLAQTLEPYDDYFDAECGRSTFNPRFLAEGTVRGRTYWLPWARSTPLLYFNKEIFAGAGLPTTGPKTYTELREWGQQLKGFRYNGSPVRLRAYNGGDDWYLQASTWAFGGGYSDGMNQLLTSEGSVASLEYDRACIFDDQMSYLAGNGNNDFAAGVAAVIFTSTGSLTSILKTVKFDFDVAFLPEQQTTGVPTGGSGIAMLANATTSRKQAAWQVLRYLMLTGSPDWSVGTGYLPVTTVSERSAKISTRNAQYPVYKVAQDQLERARIPDVMRRYISPASAELRQAMQKVYSDNASPAQEMRRAARALAPAIRKTEPKYDEFVA